MPEQLSGFALFPGDMGVKWEPEVVLHMRGKIVAAFLCGLVIPLAALGLWSMGSRGIQMEDRESPGLSETAAEEGSQWDRETRITVLFSSGNLRQMRLADYLTGVVLAEMPADFSPEALKAQAVVARTYTCKRLTGSKHDGAAVCTESSCCQGYQDPEDYVAQGGQASAVEKIRSAVTGTDGQVLLYEGALIDATYFSCSGGSTEDAVAVWGQDVPYLQAVESPGEEEAPRYAQRVRYTPENFRLLTGCGGEGDPATWFGPVRYTDGGGVDTIEICGEVFSGTELRGMLSLRSTKFTVEVSEGMIVIETLGFGHRVGMSQYGAQAMAQLGSSYGEILAHYYLGTVLARME